MCPKAAPATIGDDPNGSGNRKLVFQGLVLEMTLAAHLAHQQEPMHPPTVALRKFPGGLLSQVLEMTLGAHLANQREPMHPPTVALRKFPGGLLSHSARGSVTEL